MPVQRKGMRALQIWVSRVTSSYSSIEITDLTTSFRNGLAFVGIIHHFRPDLITSPDKLDPDDVMGNNDLAYKVCKTFFVHFQSKWLIATILICKVSVFLISERLKENQQIK